MREDKSIESAVYRHAETKPDMAGQRPA